MTAIDKYWNIFFNSFGDYWSYLQTSFTNPSWNNYFYWLLGVSVLFLFLEVIVPWRKDQPVLRKDFWLDAFYMFFNFFLFSLIGYYAISNVFVELFNDFLAIFGIKNLVAIKVNDLPGWVQLVLLFVIRDFIQWNTHRLLHRVPWLWQFHKVHHSVKQMGFAAHLRYHWMENVVYRFIEYIPLAMIGFGIKDFFVVHIFTLAIGHFNHSNINFDIGLLKYIFNNPRMHIWHHAKELPKEHPHGVNYGLTLSVWDYIFGTACIPGEGRDVILGFNKDENFPEDFIHQQAYPFLKKKIIAEGEVKPRMKKLNLPFS